ncbi:uncharacterized protein LOC133201700 [Saccostrea echinata]|uniref:uncharacterized protein LOC133201700 n=1 Tax=Saccostrea echinata TaxID=191078 RepID=UPI002A83172C|nr:uncharacterized protein LOC133201700 [Saccostrea echinata]
MLWKYPQTVNKVWKETFTRCCTNGKNSLSDRWKTDENIIMNTFARRKAISERYGIERKSEDTPVTHVSMNPPRKFHVPKADNETFLREYSRAVIDGQYMTLLELPTVYSPLRVDVDVEKIDSSSSGLTEEYIEHLLNLYVEESLEYLADPFSVKTERTLVAYIMQRKKNLAVESGAKEGIHAIFPDIVFPTNLHNKLFHIPIAETVKKETSGEKEFKIVIDQIGKNPWFMLGSQKHCDLYPYTVNYVFKYAEGLQPLTLNLNSESEVFYWVDRFSIRYKKCSQISDAAGEDIKKEIQSIEESGEEDLSMYNSLKSKFCSSQNQVDKKSYSKTPQKFSGRIVTPHFVDVKDLVQLYDDEISHAYRSWSSVGFALRLLCYYGNGCENDYRDLWFEFSQKSSKFNQHECERVWESFDPSKGDVIMAKRILMKYANDSHIKRFRNLLN